MIQIRNLNIDPDAFAEIMPPFTKAIGTKEFIRQLHEEFPDIVIGNFSHYQKRRINHGHQSQSRNDAN